MSEETEIKTYGLFQQMIDDGENPNLNEVWNAAIEAALEKVRMDHTIYHIQDQIRSLKK